MRVQRLTVSFTNALRSGPLSVDIRQNASQSPAMNKVPALRTLREQIVDHLRTEVLSGSYQEGDPLREQHLAKRYGVSRGPIRDALLQLTKEGLLVAERNRGMKVKRRPSKQSRKLFVALRREIETHALREIFSSISAGDVAGWESQLEDFHQACIGGSFPDVVERDMAFHRSLVERVGDEDLIAVWLPLMTHMLLPYSRHKDLLESYEEHRAIVQAIKDRNLKAALAALVGNIQ
jgi:DNA-binding GntR family transcriptional regulator